MVERCPDPGSKICVCSSVVERCPDKTEVEGPIPSRHTLNELNGFEEDKEWALRSNAHAVSPVFANEFWVRKGAPPSAVRTVFSPRRRFASNAILTKYKKNFCCINIFGILAMHTIIISKSAEMVMLEQF